MATTTRPAARVAMPPADRARVALWAFVAINVVAVELIFFASGPGKNSILTVARFLGLHAALVMMLQLLLIARLPWLDRRIGMDRLTAWHRWTGFTLLWTVVTHATLVVLGYASLDGVPPWETWWALAGVPASLLGMVAATIVVAMGVVSLRYARRRVSYETWHALHLLLYLAVVVGLVHQALETTTFDAPPAAAAYWWALWALVLLALLVNRCAVPVWRNARHRFEVAEVVPESADVVSVRVTGRHLDRLPARAGQFMIWRFPDHGGWWQANPFSLSAAPDGRSLRLTAKAVGSTSASLRTLGVGSRVFAEGPYGAFTAAQQTGAGLLLIAGGVGVTPIRALLEESVGAPPSARAPVVLYRVRNPAEAVLLDELESLAEGQGARVHVLSGRTGVGSPPYSPFDPDRLVELVPDLVDRDVFVCGPPAMTATVLASLKALGVPRARVHAERFALV